MTEMELRSWVDTFFTVAQAELERTGSIKPKFYLHYPPSPARIGITEEFKTLDMPDGTEALMNDPKAKRVLWAFLRQLIEEAGADAFLTVQDMWFGKETPAGAQHREEAAKLHAQGMQDLVDRGWIDRQEVVAVVAQTPSMHIQAQRAYTRDGRRVLWTEEPSSWIHRADGTGDGKLSPNSNMLMFPSLARSARSRQTE